MVLVVVVVVVLDGHVADRLVGRGLDVCSGDLRLLAGGPYLQVPVRPPFPIRQGHVVRTPADGAGAAQVAVVVVDGAAAVEVTAAAATAGACAGRLEVAVARTTATPTRTSGVLLRPAAGRRRLVELGVVVVNAHKITATGAAVPYR